MRISDWSSDVCSSDLVGFWRRSSIYAENVLYSHSSGEWSALRSSVPPMVAPSRSCRISCWRNLMRSSAGTPSRRSEEHTSELQSLMRISYAVFCLKKKKNPQHNRIQLNDGYIYDKCIQLTMPT